MNKKESKKENKYKEDNKEDNKEEEINCISVRGNVHNQHPAIAKSKLDTPPRNRH